MSGYSLAHAVMMMIPEAWEQHTAMDARRRAFYEYHAAMMEPWDGPAAMVFTDGRQIGATLDRNGLRPARYIVTDDGLVVMASESGVLPIAESRIVKKWRLQPGKMFLIDFEQGRIVDDEELKHQFASAKPYRQWVDGVRIKLEDLPASAARSTSRESLLDRQQAFGYTQEDIKFLMSPMAQAGEEGIGSMGNDSPLAVLSDKDKPLYNYFKQLFAQVTNPPIDPIREAIVMSLVSFIGPKPNLLDINAVNPPMRLEVSQPILDFADMARLREIEGCTAAKFKSHELDITYPLAWGAEGVEAKLASMCAESVDAIRSGHNILIISDRKVDREHVALPAVLALSAVHQHLVREGLRTTAGLVVETGSAREVHHFSVLAGYGAEAVHPYLALETLAALHNDLPSELGTEKATYNYIKAIGKGLSKIMSKMGVSTYMSYCGAQLFEAIGLEKTLVEKYFHGTASQIGGIGIFEVAEEAIRMHRAAFGDDPVLEGMLDAGGEYAWRVRGEEHMWTPDAIAKLQHGVRANRFETYQEYARLINDQSRRHMTLRGLFDFVVDPAKSIPIAEVEPAAEIVKRFATGAMSLGSISTEAHATLAVAMNRIGGKSNTGEGGEDPARYRAEMRGETIAEGTHFSEIIGKGDIVVDFALKAGDSLRSRIKQVASGRFGVTTEYLVSADQLQIKMAQGAKPGEGGQLPGGKVSDYIGKLRYSVPGVGLISPPPHHDIYSIEDLAQLIHDLKNANKTASISVKLVSEVGVGTIAAGVAKAKADHVVIAGHDGGTGASPWSSIKHAGTPWELGLAETQQTLVLNRLRGRIRVQADGQMKTGRDVVVGALLGADEFGFATAPLVAEGCIMMRKCHLNTCPVGVATQDPVLRAKFQGRPEHVVNYFFFVAEEARQIMAQLGVRTFDELIGRVDLLDTRKGIAHWKAKGLDFSRVLHAPAAPASVARRHVEEQDHGLAKALDVRLIEKCRPAIERGEKVQLLEEARNVNRTVGAMLSGELIRARPGGPARQHHLHPDGRHRRAELRRVPRQGHHHLPDRRCQRLHRQGPVRRPPGDPAEHRLPRRCDDQHHRRQHRPLRRDQRRGVLPRRRRRALRGPPLGRDRRGRRHGRPRLRVHDRRHGRGARQDRAQLRRGHERRHRLRLRRGRPVRVALQHLDGLARAGGDDGGAGEVGRARDLAPRADRRGAAEGARRRPSQVDREPARPRDPRPLGRGARQVRQGVPERVQAGARRDQPEGDDRAGRDPRRLGRRRRDRQGQGRRPEDDQGQRAEVSGVRRRKRGVPQWAM